MSPLTLPRSLSWHYLGFSCCFCHEAFICFKINQKLIVLMLKTSLAICVFFNCVWQTRPALSLHTKTSKRCPSSSSAAQSVFISQNKDPFLFYRHFYHFRSPTDEGTSRGKMRRISSRRGKLKVWWGKKSQCEQSREEDEGGGGGGRRGQSSFHLSISTSKKRLRLLWFHQNLSSEKMKRNWNMSSNWFLMHLFGLVYPKFYLLNKINF